MKKILLACLMLLAVTVCADISEAANVSLKGVQNGYFKNYPKSEGYPNIQNAFEHFFEKPSWGVAGHFSHPYFQGIASLNERKAKFLITFGVDAFKEGAIIVLEMSINDTKVYGYSLVTATSTNTVDPNDLLAAIFLNFDGNSESDDDIPGVERPDSFHNEAAYDMFANAIDQYTIDAIRGKKPTFEEVALIENDMDGDETVYIRAWKEKNFYIVRGYEDDTWQNDMSYLIRFWTKDPSMQFGNGMGDDIKVGMMLSELSSYFGDMLQQEGKDQYSVLGDGTALGFTVRNGAVEAITYMLGMPYPEKLSKYLGLE